MKALDRKVWLPSGGSLVIDRTEAMTVVDVNTGKFIGSGGNLEQTVTRNNMEAAEEIVRQLRLRDIGGIIVIDFIDMVLESNRDLVLRRLTECLGRDRTKHQVAEVTSLGLVQMTRKRVGQGLLEVFSEPCEHCRGRGVVVHLDPVDEKRRSGGNGGGGGSGSGNGSGGGGHAGRRGQVGGGRRDRDDGSRRPRTSTSRAPRRRPAGRAATAADGEPAEGARSGGRRNRGRRNRGQSGEDRAAEDAAVLAGEPDRRRRRARGRPRRRSRRRRSDAADGRRRGRSRRGRRRRGRSPPASRSGRTPSEAAGRRRPTPTEDVGGRRRRRPPVAGRRRRRAASRPAGPPVAGPAARPARRLAAGPCRRGHGRPAGAGSGTLVGLHRHRAGARGCRRVGDAARPAPGDRSGRARRNTELDNEEANEESVVYAVVKAGGSQHKVAVGDTFTINRLAGAAGDTVALPAILLVDGETVTSDAAALAKVTVTGEIVEHGKGPKIQHPQVQEQDRLPQAAGAPSAPDQRRGPRHLEGLTPTWHTRRAPRRPATVATPTPSASA